MTLQGCRAKLRRANQHIDALEKDIESFLGANTYPVSIERQPDQTFAIKLVNPPALPYDTWALTIGDAVHNLRSSLDFITWELAGSDPGDRETMFPIFDTEDGWNTRAARRMKRLAPDVRTFIQEMQPYKGGEPTTYALSALRRLDDADKHQLLTVTTAVQESVSVTLRQPPGSLIRNPSIMMYPNVTLEHDAIVAAVDLSLCSPDVGVNAEFTPLIVFGDALGFPPRASVVPNLRVLHGEATAIADKFEARFFH